MEELCVPPSILDGVEIAIVPVDQLLEVKFAPLGCGTRDDGLFWREVITGLADSAG